MVIGCRDGQCDCGNLIRSYQKFCDECGIKLDWGDVRKRECDKNADTASKEEMF